MIQVEKAPGIDMLFMNIGKKTKRNTKKWKVTLGVESGQEFDYWF